MDYIYNVFMNFLKCQRFGWMDFYRGSEIFQGFLKMILIYVLKVNKILVDLEQHENE